MTEIIRKSEKTGSNHWILHKITSVILLFLTIWIGYSFFAILNDNSYMESFFSYIINSFLAISFICASLYHGCLSAQTMFEDYISCKRMRKISILTVKLFSLITAILTVITIIRLHIV
jgi:succinate dehydrogenase / fumarate reductase membrane anchor subunit